MYIMNLKKIPEKVPQPRLGCNHKPATANPNLFLETRNSKPETPGWLQAIDEGRLDFDTLHAIGAGRPLDLDLSKCSVSA